VVINHKDLFYLWPNTGQNLEDVIFNFIGGNYNVNFHSTLPILANQQLAIPQAKKLYKTLPIANPNQRLICTGHFASLFMGH
jgi:hypothetical protein